MESEEKPEAWEGTFDEKFPDEIYERISFDEFSDITKEVKVFIRNLLNSERERLADEVLRVKGDDTDCSCETSDGCNGCKANGYNDAIDIAIELIRGDN